MLIIAGLCSFGLAGLLCVIDLSKVDFQKKEKKTKSDSFIHLVTT